MNNGFYKENIIDKILLEKKSNNIIKAIIESYNEVIILINTNETVVYSNKIANDFFEVNDLSSRDIFNVLEIDKNYIQKILTKGCAFSSIKLIVKQEVFYIDIVPIMFDSQVVGMLIALNKNKNSFTETFKLANNINKEVELFYSMYYDEIMVTNESGKIISVNNPLCMEYYNLSEDDLLNFNVKELEKKGIFKPSVTTKILKEKKYTYIIQKTQNNKILMVYGFPVYDDNFRLLKVFSTSKDLTEIYQLKEKLNKTKQLLEKYHNKLNELKNEQNLFKDIIYRSSKMRTIMDLIRKMSRVDSNVLLTGESGVGKSLFAKLIHSLSNRKKKEFININCASIPEALIESELFGYEKGAFTGARSEGKIGYLELANEGTIFLDEISELPITMQAKLLKAIDEKSFTHLGSTKTIHSNFRLIVATNKDLNILVKENKFREDLFYRINVVQIHIPPLRERKEDIFLLANFFLTKYNKKYNKNKKLGSDAYNVLMEYNWPGNIRELENLIEQLVVTIDRQIIKIADLPIFLRKDTLISQDLQFNKTLPLKAVIENIEKQIILDAYQKYKSTYQVSKILKISQPTVVRKLKKYTINTK